MASDSQASASLIVYYSALKVWFAALATPGSFSNGNARKSKCHYRLRSMISDLYRELQGKVYWNTCKIGVYSGMAMVATASLRLDVLGAESVVLVNVVLALPGVREPDVGGVDGREVRDIRRDLTSLGLKPGVGSACCTAQLATVGDSLVVDNENTQLGLGAEALTLLDVGDLGELLLNVLLELADGVDEGGAGVVDLVDDEDATAKETTGAGELGAELVDGQQTKRTRGKGESLTVEKSIHWTRTTSVPATSSI